MHPLRPELAPAEPIVTPAMTEPIPVFVPHVGVDTLKHLTDALDVGWLGMGATTKAFEERIAAYLGLDGRFVVATNTGTSALHIALLTAGVGPGDEVIVPSFNYVADHHAVTYTGARPVLCDVREDDLGVDCEKAAALISERTKAIIPLHFAGIPCDQAGVFALAREHGLRVIEDACHAFGSTIDGKRIGSYGDIACFSFDPVKVITSIDGGCVIINNEAELEKLHRLRILGVDKDTMERYKNSRSWDYDVIDEGFRYHLTNIAASVGLSQIKRVDEFVATRREVCTRYSGAFSHIDGLRILRRNYADVSPFIYSMRVLEGRRADLIAHLNDSGIATCVHFLPVHQH
jgi:dTDP-4-amino-4,6-dideoxygalactose transaminase